MNFLGGSKKRIRPPKGSTRAPVPNNPRNALRVKSESSLSRSPMLIPFDACTKSESTWKSGQVRGCAVSLLFHVDSVHYPTISPTARLAPLTVSPACGLNLKSNRLTVLGSISLNARALVAMVSLFAS